MLTVYSATLGNIKLSPAINFIISITIKGIEKAVQQSNTDIRIFGKPSTRPYRRMGVALVNGTAGSDINELRVKAKAAAACISIT
jgi:phosphoribosylglycinamide formyltransferase 2